MLRFSRPLAAFAAFHILSTAVAFAQLPSANLSWMFPAGGQQGKEVEVTIAGSDLDGVNKLLFTHPGITAEPKIVEIKDKEDPEKVEKKPSETEFIVKIAGDVPTGAYEVRTVGRFGMSNPRAFVVGDQDEVVEEGNNNSLESPMEVPLEAIVNGRVAGDSFDCFKFKASKGQRVLVNCQAYRIDSRAEMALALYDAMGKLLSMDRDTNYFDPMIDFSVPEDGEYIVKAHDFTYQGGNEYFYRLSISTRPYIDYIFPPAGEAGQKTKFTLFGRNLPGGTPAEGIYSGKAQLDKLEVEIELPQDPTENPPSLARFTEPGDAEVDGYVYRHDSPEGRSNPVLISFATAPVVPEQEPNNDPLAPQKINVPCEFVGQFYPARDRDWILFDAKKGDVFWLEVFSQRLGVPTDPYLLVQQVKPGESGALEVVRDVTEADDVNRNFGNPPFDEPSHDPSYRFAAPDDGTYRVLISDRYSGARPRPHFVYRLSIRPEQPDFRLLATFGKAPAANQPPTAFSPVLRTGGREVIVVQAFRRDGFDGPITLCAEGLPDGVKCPEVTIGPGENKAFMIVGAQEGAQPWSGDFRILGFAELESGQVSRKARGCTVVWSAGNNKSAITYARINHGMGLAVMDGKEPVEVDLGDDLVFETARAGKVTIPLKVKRQDGVKGDLKLDAQGLPKDVKMNSVTLKEKDGEAKAEVTIPANINPGSYFFYLKGTTKYAYARNEGEKPKDINVEVISYPITLDIAAAPANLTTDESLAVKQGEKKEISVSLERLFDFDDAVDLQLELPKDVKGISAAKVNVEKGKNDAKLEIAVAADATPGKHEVQVRGTLKYNNQNLTIDQPIEITVEEVKQEKKES